AERLLALTLDADPVVRRRSLEGLASLREPRSLAPALRALELEPDAQLAALQCLAAVGGPEQSDAVAATAVRSRSLEVLQTAVRALAAWKQSAAVAKVQGAAGLLLQWTSDDQSVSASGADSRVTIGRSAEAEFVVAE